VALDRVSASRTTRASISISQHHLSEVESCLISLHTDSSVVRTRVHGAREPGPAMFSKDEKNIFVNVNVNIEFI